MGESGRRGGKVGGGKLRGGEEGQEKEVAG